MLAMSALTNFAEPLAFSLISLGPWVQKPLSREEFHLSKASCKESKRSPDRKSRTSHS